MVILMAILMTVMIHNVFSSGIVDGTSTTRFPMTDRFTGFSQSFVATVGFYVLQIIYIGMFDISFVKKLNIHNIHNCIP